LVPLGFMIGLMFGCLGMVVTARAPAYDFFNYYFTLGISVMFLFSGVFFPLDSLPEWARAVAWVLPLSHAVAVCRGVAAGSVDAVVLGHVAWMLAVSAGAFALAERMVRRRLLV